MTLWHRLLRLRANVYKTQVQYHSKVSWQSWLETWFSILKFLKNQVTIDFWGASFEFRFSRIENRVSRIDQVSSFETQRIFRGSLTEILRKWFRSQKQSNSGEQNNWHMASFFRTNLLLNVCIARYFFVLCIFHKTHAVRLATLKLITWWEQTNLASKYVYNFSCRREWFFLCVWLQPGASLLFSFAWLQPAAQNVNKR